MRYDTLCIGCKCPASTCECQMDEDKGHPDAPCECGVEHDEEELAFFVCKACGRWIT